MGSINKVILVGHVGKDPEVKYLENNVCVARFTLATNESYTNKEGKKVETTEWHNIVFWRGIAEVVEKYVRKGMQVYIEGRIKSRSYDEGGVKKYFHEIVGENLTFLGHRQQDSNGSQAALSGSHESVPVAEEPPQNDGLPF